MLVQARALGELSSLAEMREAVARSVQVERYEPSGAGPANDETYSRFLSVTGIRPGDRPRSRHSKETM